MAIHLPELLLNNRPFHPVVPFDTGKDNLLQLDFTEANTDLTTELVTDTPAFSRYIQDRLQAASARYGIGGYNELRTMYSRSDVFGAATAAEPRRLHLGIDIWGPEGTEVMAPMDGVVHSSGFHPELGDYGAVIILSHQLDRKTFYTLYGHLSLPSVKSLHEGRRISRGDVFATFGPPAENGWWPPHLHFQVVEDMQGWKSDYPGVCALSEQDEWLHNCPNPDLILNMMQWAR